jgi:hypothetical protein
MTPKVPKEWQEFAAQQDKILVDMAPSQGREWNRQIMRFVVAWADEMERLMSLGETVASCAERASYEADETTTEGLTLLMFQYCVGVLVKFWAYGDQLRDWHNKRFVPDGDISCCGESLIDCASIHTPMGRATLIAPYRYVMQLSGGYQAVVDKAQAAVFLRTLEEHYTALGVIA